MDDRLRNAIWNFIWENYLDTRHSSIADAALGGIWANVFGEPYDVLLSRFGDFDTRNAKRLVRSRFFATSWHRVYSILEHILSTRASKAERDNANAMLSREGAAYRLLGSVIVSITNEEELTEVESVLQHAGPFDVASQHIRQAVEHLSDRSNPDARNVVKESISAVESAVKVASGDPKSDIEKGLKILGLHSQLEQAWKNMYNWTSDEGGVRHGKEEISQVGLPEARYMVVASSAFVNYLIAKHAEKI